MDQQQIDELTPMEAPPEVMDAMRQLIADGASDVAKLPEHLFVSNLLPILSNRSGNVDISVWLDIAGSALRPIDVYDPATGETLFRVPALYTSPPTRAKGDTRSSLTTLVEQANQRSVQHPAIGQTYLRTRLSQHDVAGGVDLECVRAWNAILVRYGHEPVIALPDDPNAPVSAAETAKPTGILSMGDEQDDF